MKTLRNVGIDFWFTTCHQPTEFLNLMRSELCNKVYVKVNWLNDDDLYAILLLVGEEALFATKLDSHEKK